MMSREAHWVPQENAGSLKMEEAVVNVSLSFVRGNLPNLREF